MKIKKKDLYLIGTLNKNIVCPYKILYLYTLFFYFIFYKTKNLNISMYIV